MSLLLTVCVIVANIPGLFCVLSGKFIRFHGYKLAAYLLVPVIELNYSKINCAEKCLQTSCLSFNYHSQTGECQLNTDSPYTNTGAVQEAAGWTIYHLQKENDWELVFRAQANNSLSPYAAWVGNLSLPTPVEDGCRLMTETFTCTTIYRSEVLNKWNSESISEVRLELYKSGSRVVNMQFQGTGSTLTDWFTNETLIESSWSTMSKDRLFNYFSIFGYCGRRFIISEQYAGCPADLGWMTVIDVDVTCTCSFDYQPGLPAFLFSPGENVTQWDKHTYGSADVLAVFIKR